LPTAQSCQKIFDDFGTVDDISEAFSSTTVYKYNHSDSNKKGSNSIQANGKKNAI
jgi:hypothetical protein